MIDFVLGCLLIYLMIMLPIWVCKGIDRARGIKPTVYDARDYKKQSLIDQHVLNAKQREYMQTNHW